MRQRRFVVPGREVAGGLRIYHCVSRVLRPMTSKLVLGAESRAMFVEMMRVYEKFCGVRVLAYGVMPDHVALLVGVPERPTEGLSDREFFGLLSSLYNKPFIEEVRAEMREQKSAGNEEGVDAIKQKYLCRMWDLSQFMKTLKQRFTQWFNGRHGREGTLWRARFKSVIVEDGYAALVMAAYVDLSPVREGLVTDPRDYPCCSYAEAVSGGAVARAGIERVVQAAETGGPAGRAASNWRQVSAEYRKMLRTGEQLRRMDAEELEARLSVGEKLTLGELLRQRVRCFEDGGAIGSRSFVERIWEENRHLFSAKRKSGARAIRGCAEPLFALRDLQVRAIQ